MLKTERREQSILARGYALGRLDEMGEEPSSRRRHDVAEMFVDYYITNRNCGISRSWELFWSSKITQEFVYGTITRPKDDPGLVALLAEEEAIDRQIYGN